MMWEIEIEFTEILRESLGLSDDKLTGAARVSMLLLLRWLLRVILIV